MSGENGRNEWLHLTKGRLEALSDGIFAFAMTLLVIGLNLPDKASMIQSTEYMLHFLYTIRYDFFHYILAFLILGAFWLTHHIQLQYIQGTDKTFIWLNLITLLFVGLLPFSTSFAGDFGDVPSAAIVFQLNLLIIGIGMFCQWKYTTGNKQLIEPGLKPSFVWRVGAHSLIVPVVSLACILAALAGSTWSSAVYMTIPLGEAVVRHLQRRLA